MLHIESALIQNVSETVVEPPGGGLQEAGSITVTPPTYILEESLRNQRLWKETAGNRPPQPEEERAFFEQLYAQNFARSKVEYDYVKKEGKGGEDEEGLTVISKGDNGFGNTMSKSFPRANDGGEAVVDGVDTISVTIASYRVVESKKHGKYAQYLVIFCDGDFRNTVGIWKRYSEFSDLSKRVVSMGGHTESCVGVVSGLNPLAVTEDDHDNHEIMTNAITSWKVLKNHQMWYRCFDADYLKFKVFLLERFLHDVLLESSNPQIIRDFVGVNSSEVARTTE